MASRNYSARPSVQNAPTQSFSTDRPNQFTKLDLKPRRYHAYNVVLFIFGTLFPPLAVAARFGIGGDFWLNLLLTICGYIPGHAHNFYIQNIRNNKNHKRTPKWAIRYGLVDDSEIRRKERRSQWSGRYKDRLPRSTLENAELEEGQVPDRTPGASTSDANVNGHEGNGNALWNEEEQFYGQRKNASTDSGAGRWRYPANFEDAEVDEQPKKKRGFLGGKKKKDRWELSEDARRGAAVPDGEYVGDGPGGGKKKEKKKKEGKVKRRKKGGDGVGNDDDPYVRNPSTTNTDSRSEFEEPEDAVGGLYGDRRTAEPSKPTSQQADQELFQHQF